MRVEILNPAKANLPREFVRHWVRDCWRELRARGAINDPRKFTQLRLIFVDKKLGAKLNIQFRKKRQATDVLSFSSFEKGLLGELILCHPLIQSQAKQHKLSYRQELGYLILHGMMHLLGFEHEGSARKARVMFAVQDEIFEQLIARKK